MSDQRFARFVCVTVAVVGVMATLAVGAVAAAAEKPNVILILADDLGYAELGCYGQKKIRTPNIDRLAQQGMRFTQYYSGSPVCAPSRCVLMTGKHSGHAVIRTNREVKPEGQEPLPAAEVTIAELFQRAGYTTGAIGKWGLGPPQSEGDPLRQGFDFFYGYNCQRHAHNHYPTYLYRNAERIELPTGDPPDLGKEYSHDLFEREALGFIRANREKPFFLYLPFIIPHVALQVPEDSLAEYRGKWDDPPYTGGKGYRPHAHPRAAYAAMVTRLDRTVGRLVELVDEVGLGEETLIVFTSDNGPTHGGVGGSDSEFFNSAGSFRGLKGSVYEGGIRVPFIARWTGKIKPGTTSDLACVAYDLMPTLCEAATLEPSENIDGISFLPTLLGRGEQRRHEFLYWEFPSYGGQQAVRMGDWKGVRQALAKGAIKTELYNLSRDVGERQDMAAEEPAIVKQIEQIMAENHVRSTLFPFKSLDQ
ncbi:MAG: arylsulfatase [Pirellulales bacterium]